MLLAISFWTIILFGNKHALKTKIFVHLYFCFLLFNISFFPIKLLFSITSASTMWRIYKSFYFNCIRQGQGTSAQSRGPNRHPQVSGTLALSIRCRLSLPNYKYSYKWPNLSRCTRTLREMIKAKTMCPDP